jgi:hypothetical protein
MSAAAARPARTAANGRTTDPMNGVKAAFVLLVIGVALLLGGAASVSGSHEDPAVTTCDNQTMQPGDSCTTYQNNAPTRTESYEEVRADHVAAIQRDKTQGPVLLVLGTLLVGGFVVSVLVAVSRPKRS